MRSFRVTESRSGVAGGRPQLDLEAVEDQAVVGLLRVPHVGVEVAVDLRRVGEQRGELEHVAVDLELDPRHVVQDVPVSIAQHRRVPDGVVHRVQRDRGVLGREPVATIWRRDACSRTSPSRSSMALRAPVVTTAVP